MVLLLADLDQFGQAALQDFDREVGRDAPDQLALEKQAQRLEAKLQQLYAVAATMAKREETLEAVAAVWARMVTICDGMAKALSDLQPQGQPRLESYDRILDIRNQCEENRALHA